ncbi:MAG: hypothetical protein ACI379_12910 [Nocardioides sp.]|uniref:hypothetical protein n=1 Tax=Nocardioides sp. TaxID=35761 RepID=UPI003EFE3A97
MSIPEPPPLPSRRAAAGVEPPRPALPPGLSLDTIRHAAMYARERLEEDLLSFVVFDRANGEAVYGARTWPEGNAQLFELSQRVDARLPIPDELGEIRDWWLLDLPVDKKLVVFLAMGPRHRGVMIVDNTYGRIAKVFGNVIPAIQMRCREGW